MGFYIRKSISVGPFRFGLSKSGANVSVGVRGLRLGTGPRGTYVHMGLGGVYYRATIPVARPSAVTPAVPQPAPSLPTGSPKLPVAAPAAVPMITIDSAAAADISDSSSAELLREIGEKQRKFRLWPLAATLTVFALVIAPHYGPSWLSIAIAILGSAAIYFAYQRDMLVRTVVLFYQMDAALERAYDGLHSCAMQMAACGKIWHVEAKGNVSDRKYNGGAHQIVRRNPTFIRRSAPPYVRTNVETIAIGVGSQTVYFFPDRLLIFDAQGVGAVSYARLQLDAGTTRFVEDEALARDATVIEYTWQYVNQKGGADKRFKQNRRLPVCLYDELSIRSTSGLNELLQLSRPGTADDFVHAVRRLASCLPP